jgi:Zn-dependent alcohol dehydrogenase
MCLRRLPKLNYRGDRDKIAFTLLIPHPPVALGEAVLGRTPMITALNLIASGQVDVTPMISEILPLAEVQRGFDALWSGQNIVSLLQP